MPSFNIYELSYFEPNLAFLNHGIDSKTDKFM